MRRIKEEKGQKPREDGQISNNPDIKRRRPSFEDHKERGGFPEVVDTVAPPKDRTGGNGNGGRS